MDDTETLVGAASQGSQPAIEELMARHLPGLRAYIRLRAGPAVRAREEVSDVVQSVCREILEHLDRFQYGGEAGFKHWLYATALRRIQKKHRFHHAQKRDLAREVAPPRDGSRVPDLQHYARTLSTPSAAAVAHEEMGRIELAFDVLSDEQREVVVQSRLMGLSHAEIAANLGKSEGATRVLLHRALVRLAAALDRPTGPGS